MDAEVATSPGPEAPTKSSKTKLSPQFVVRVEEDFAPPGGEDFRSREAKRLKLESDTIGKLLKMSDADLAKFVRAQLQAQLDVTDAKLKLNKAEGMKIGDVFADMEYDGDDEGDDEVGD